jgi:hypothetical protein
MCTSLHVKYPLFLLDYNDTRIFSTDFRKILKYQNDKIRPVESSCSMRMDGQTDTHDDGNSRFSQFWESAWKPYSK